MHESSGPTETDNRLFKLKTQTNCSYSQLLNTFVAIIELGQVKLLAYSMIDHLKRSVNRLTGIALVHQRKLIERNLYAIHHFKVKSNRPKLDQK